MDNKGKIDTLIDKFLNQSISEEERMELDSIINKQPGIIEEMETRKDIYITHFFTWDTAEIEGDETTEVEEEEVPEADEVESPEDEEESSDDEKESSDDDQEGEEDLDEPDDEDESEE